MTVFVLTEINTSTQEVLGVYSNPIDCRYARDKLQMLNPYKCYEIEEFILQ